MSIVSRRPAGASLSKRDGHNSESEAKLPHLSWNVSAIFLEIKIFIKVISYRY